MKLTDYEKQVLLILLEMVEPPSDPQARAALERILKKLKDEA